MEEKIKDLLELIDDHKEEFSSNLYNQLALHIADIHSSINDDTYIILWGVVIPKTDPSTTGFFCKTLKLIEPQDITELDENFNIITGQEYMGVDTKSLVAVVSVGMGINAELFEEIKENVDDVRCGYKYISDCGQVIINKYKFSR